ncbi:MAG: carboxylate-amine ligase [Acidimicrobiales bacterium]
MSDDFTIGVEEEFSIIDAVTGELRPRVQRLLPGAKALLGDDVQAELNLSQIETGTSVCATLAEVRVELQRLRRRLGEAAEQEGSRVVSAGSHPNGRWQEQPVNPDKERYRHLEEDFRLTARQQLVSGCHVHIGLADPDLAIAVLNRCRTWLSPLVALAANSPFWIGVDSGYASYRTMVWSQWPTTGMPEPLADRAAYDRLVEDLTGLGVIDDATFLYWDVRPSARYDTLEFRVTDACSTVEEAVMVAGLVRALARTCATEEESGSAPPSVRGELVHGAKWRAARYGLDGELADLSAGGKAPAAEVIARFLDHLRPALDEHGDWEEVQGLVDQTLRAGNGASRQRAAFARTGDLKAVVDHLVSETAGGAAERPGQVR